MPRPLRKGEKDPATGETAAEKARRENAERIRNEPPETPTGNEE